MIRLLVSDMDGTLLDKTNQATDETVKTIKKLQKKGIKFVIITGRDPFAMREFAKETNIVCDVLCANGACVLHEDQSIEYRHMLTKQQIDKIIDIFEKYNLEPTFYSDQGPITLLTPEEYFVHLRDVMVPAFQLLVPDSVYTDEDLMKIVNSTICTTKDKLSEYKIFKIVTKSVDIENLHEAKDETKEIKGVSSVSTSKAYIEANAWQAQKGTALKEYAKEHGIKLEEVIAIGDNENDTSMLEIAEIQSIAMGNAVEDIKKICKYETKRNDEDGVAYVISHLL